MHTLSARPANPVDPLHRYVEGFWLYVRQLRRSQWLTADELHARQLVKLRALLRIAATQVPHYRDLFRQLGAGPEDVRDLADLSRLPVLTKQQVREQPDRFLNPSIDRRALIEDHTSGSTGEPFRMLLTSSQKTTEMACAIRFWRWAGYRTGDRIAAFRHYIPATPQDPPWWLDRRTRTLFFSVYDMTVANLSDYVTAFNGFRPAFVRGYPSSIYILAQFALSEGRTLSAPRAVITSSETLSPEMRATIERAFQCPVFDWWGTNERLVTACQCEQRGRYHVNAEAGILELVPEAGGSHRLIGTGLLNPAMPLIRYDLGDLAVPADGACPCGRGLPMIGGILGRRDDLIVTGEQKFIPPVRFYTLFETWNQVRQFQVVQTAPDNVVVHLVCSRELTDADRTGLRQKLQRFLGERVAIEFAFTDRIVPEPSGKIRNVISQVHR